MTIGSRGSELALRQTTWVKNELQKKNPGLRVDFVVIKTTGDNILDSPLSKIGDKGLFTKEIEIALLEHHIDAAVHSLKDVPTELPAGLTIGAVTKREDVRDVFIAHPQKPYKSFNDVPQKAKIATGSLRRRSQLLHWRPDLEIIEIRGNLNTRLAKLGESDWDGMILALAGVLRLGLEKRITEILPTEKMLPAVGQGALAIEVRTTDKQTLGWVQRLASTSTTMAVAGERALLRYLEGGCQIPIGTFGRVENNEFHLDAIIGSLDGKKIVRGKTHGKPEQAEELGRQLAETLVRSGGREILDEIRKTLPHESSAV